MCSDTLNGKNFQKIYVNLQWHRAFRYVNGQFKMGTYATTSFLQDYVGWLVGRFGFNGPLRQFFSLYRAVSRREGERGEKG